MSMIQSLSKIRTKLETMAWLLLLFFNRAKTPGGS